MQSVIWRYNLGVTGNQNVAQLRPILAILINKQRGFVTSLDVARSFELARLNTLGFFVQREKEMLPVKGIADGYGGRMALRVASC